MMPSLSNILGLDSEDSCLFETYMLQSKLQSLALAGRYHSRFRFGHCRCRMRNRMRPTVFELHRQGLEFLPCQYLANPKYRCNSGRMDGICHHLNRHHSPFRNHDQENCLYLPLGFGKEMNLGLCNHLDHRRLYQYSNKHRVFRRCRHLDHTCPKFRHCHHRYLNCLGYRRSRYLGLRSSEFHLNLNRRLQFL